MFCTYKDDHVIVQIPDEDWKCPKCGVGVEVGPWDKGWVMEDCVNYECEKLHNQDTIVCQQCGFGMTGKEYSNWYANTKCIKKKNPVKGKGIICPCCQGKGTVSKRVLNSIQKFLSIFNKGED